jgi:hypothetical protein
MPLSLNLLGMSSARAMDSLSKNCCHVHKCQGPRRATLKSSSKVLLLLLQVWGIVCLPPCGHHPCHWNKQGSPTLLNSQTMAFFSDTISSLSIYVKRSFREGGRIHWKPLRHLGICNQKYSAVQAPAVTEITGIVVTVEREKQISEFLFSWTDSFLLHLTD